MSKFLPFVSVILPVYNGERTLAKTLESLIGQTFQNFEILVGIDGTKDKSKAIAQSFFDERIKIIENETNLGLGLNLNKLIANTSNTATYIAMAEQDDIYGLDRLQLQVDVMESDDTIGLVSGIAEFQGQSGNLLFPDILINKKQFPVGKDMFDYLYKNQLKVVNTCMMIRKEVHLSHNLKFTNKYPNMNVDWDYVLRFSLISRVYGIPKILVKMNRLNENASITTNKDLQHETSRQLLKDFRSEFPSLISQSDYKEALKFHRKIELGHHSKLGVLVYSISYFLLYFDLYFLKYPWMRIKKYFNKR